MLAYWNELACQHVCVLEESPPQLWKASKLQVEMQRQAGMYTVYRQECNWGQHTERMKSVSDGHQVLSCSQVLVHLCLDDMTQKWSYLGWGILGIWWKEVEGGGAWGMCSKYTMYLHGDGLIMYLAQGNIYKWEGIKINREEKIWSIKRAILLRLVMSLTPKEMNASK